MDNRLTNSSLNAQIIECTKFIRKQTRDSIIWLKKHYSDVCSNGDLYINNILDSIYSRIGEDTLNSMGWKDILLVDDQMVRSIDDAIDDERCIYFINHICDSYSLYLNGDDPKPFNF
jgi:hypothetical protein